MRILFLADAVFSEIAGGSRVVARELANELADRGHDVTFLVARHKPEKPLREYPRQGIQIVRYDGAGNAFQFVRNGRRTCAALLAESSFDIVHTHFAYAALGPLQSLPKSLPRVRTFHGPWDEETWFEASSHSTSLGVMAKAWVRSIICRVVEWSNLAQSERVITLSEHFARKVMRRYLCPKYKVSVVPGGVDFVRFDTGDKQAARSRLGLSADRRILLSVRRLAKRMGLDHFLQALPTLVGKYPDILVLLAGEGPERAKLEGIIENLGLCDHAQLLGFVTEDDLPHYYRAADLFILPTTSLEGFGLVTIEALASGLAVVATPTGATPEILRELDDRLIAEGSNPEDISSVVLDYFDHDWQHDLTPQRLRAYALNRYSWSHHAQAVEEIYRSLTPAQ